jgi:pyridoxine 4-dehydrogenase
MAGKTMAAAAGVLRLGDDLEVSRVGFGAMRLSDVGTAKAVLSRALDLGVNLVDTADAYGRGLNERLIAEALHPYPSELVIATKGGQVHDESGHAKPDCRPEHLRAACEASLHRLRVDTVHLYQLHNPDPAVPLEESLGALVELRTEGKVKHIGLSNVFGDDLGAALSVAPVVSLQNRYNLSQRGSERELTMCVAEGLAFMPWFPLRAGELAHGVGPLERIALAHGATPAQVAISWLLQHSPVMVPIPGTTSTDHLEENVRAASLRLSDDALQALQSAL